MAYVSGMDNGRFGGAGQIDLEPILEVLEEWAEQLKHVDIQGFLGAGDDSEPGFGEQEPGTAGTVLSAPPEPERGPEFEGPV